MVSIAQLDNEKQALLYQVDCLKDRYNTIILHLYDIQHKINVNVGKQYHVSLQITVFYLMWYLLALHFV